MENTNHLNIWSIDQRVIHHLMLKAIYCKDAGLLEGKMGIVIAFYHLSRKTDNKVYNTYADDLLDHVLDKLPKYVSLNFEAGLSGIGWGLEYLIQNHFVEADSLEICAEIDEAIMKKDIRNITDYSLEKGLLGILHYVLIHIKGCVGQNNAVPFHRTYLIDLYDRLKSIEPRDKAKLLRVINPFTRFMEDGIIEYDVGLSHISDRLEKVNITRIDKYPLGIQKGLAGYII